MIIKITGDQSELKHKFQYNFLNDDFHIALRSFYTTNLIPNVTSKNNLFYYGDSQIAIPSGQFDFFDLESFIRTHCKVSLKLDKIRNKVSFESEKPIDSKRKKNICKLLGYPDSYPNFNPVDTINVHCNLANGQVISGGEFSHQETDIISTFKMKAYFREPIIYECSNPIYFPVQHNKISDIDIKITDENNDLINFNGAKITIILEIKNI